MEYIQNSDEDRKQILKAIGIESIDDLFKNIPKEIRDKANPLNLPLPLSELEVLNIMSKLGSKNATNENHFSFLGAGKYNHFIPSVVLELGSRNEFYTAYTPYQPEASQGNLQIIFEYQTMMCELTGMDVSNASHYDGATALCESIGMAIEHTSKRKVIISSAVNPMYRQVIKTILKFKPYEIIECPYKDGVTDPNDISRLIDNNTACIVIQNPNFFGCIEDMEALSEIAKKHQALSVASVNPVSLAVLKPPGHCGFDIASGDGQPLGNEMSFGGPSFGFIATKSDLVRRLAGRLVGQTTDKQGRRGFVLTLQAREQHIRREKATSNICTNQALMALRATIFLSCLGKQKFVELAKLNLAKAHYLASKLSNKLVFKQPFFNEFVIRAGENANFEKEKILPGVDLGKFYPELKGCLLVCVTEKLTKETLDRYVACA